ncbi:hypothetical protein CERSUDRAFT_87043 [Gelatoporia subvermispora B]|uniref:C2H2-type domain-containing protein n=1 Tax=Ceriporiopsis subvermispora (strain B) TaxID=914234 RepID=M2QNH7_CERS8|nr:hypothetical protein CERSUDRAFT_87043 [Gelatoporia subvermispora B]
MYHSVYAQQSLQYPVYPQHAGGHAPSVQYSQPSYAIQQPVTSHMQPHAAMSGAPAHGTRDVPYTRTPATGHTYGGGHASAPPAPRTSYGSASPSPMQVPGYGAQSSAGYGQQSIPTSSSRQGTAEYPARHMTYPVPAYAAPYAHSHAGQGAFIPTPAQTMQSFSTHGAGPPSGSLALAPASASAGGEQRFPCSECERTFSRAHDRKRHYESQHLQTSHNCQYCTKQFSRTDSLKRHIDNGCGEMPALEGGGS